MRNAEENDLPRTTTEFGSKLDMTQEQFAGAVGVILSTVNR